MLLGLISVISVCLGMNPSSLGVTGFLALSLGVSPISQVGYTGCNQGCNRVLALSLRVSLSFYLVTLVLLRIRDNK